MSLVARWFGGKMTVTCCPSWIMVISPPNHLANNKIASKKSTCHLWITLKQLTQFNTQYWLPTFYFSLKLIQIWSWPKYKSIDSNKILMILVSNYWFSYCSFHKHVNSGVQKPTDVCFFRCCQSSEQTSYETEVYSNAFKWAIMVSDLSMADFDLFCVFPCFKVRCLWS